MAIDRIGKGGAPPPAPETGGPGAAEKKGSVEKTFHVERPETKTAQKAGALDAAHEATPLARLRKGEIDVNGYLDLKVDQAATSLPPGLAPHEIDQIKKVLRDQMATDPGLVDLVHTATGQIPKPPED